MALPPDTPESVPIVCAGRHGIFFTRNQNVEYNGEMVTCSRFEVLCGRGDAKKWKTSFWIVDEEGNTAGTMQDWLAPRGLDRKTLLAYGANQAAYEAWVAYSQGGGESKEEEAKVVEEGQGEGEEEEEQDRAEAKVGEAEVEDDLEEAETEDTEVAVKEAAEVEMRGEGAAATEPKAEAAAGDLKKEVPNVPETAAEVMEVDLVPPVLMSPDDEVVVKEEGRGSVEGERLPVVLPGPAAEEALMEEAVEVPRDTELAAEEEMLVPKAEQAAEVEGVLGIREGEEPQDVPAEAGPSAGRGCLLDVQTLSASLHSEPADVVGAFMRLYWPDDDEWYDGEVRGFEPATGQHCVFYPLDGASEWIDLRLEALGGRVQWVPGWDSSHWPPPPPPPPGQSRYVPDAAPPEPGPQAVAELSGCVVPEEGSQLPISPGGLGPPPGVAAGRPEEAVGWRIGVWWPLDECFYYGVIEAYDQSRRQWRIFYDDGERHWLELVGETLEWVTADGEAPSAAAREKFSAENAAPPAAGGASDADGERAGSVEVMCGALRGVFDRMTQMVAMAGGSTVTPTEFEKLAGKAASKKWKSSIRLGDDSQCIGDWLAGMPPGRGHGAGGGGGVAGMRRRAMVAAAAARAASVGGAGRQASNNPGGNGRRHHREGCMCVLCKQMRRKYGDSGPPSTSVGPRLADNRVREGKTAFVRATPMLVGCGPVRQPPTALPHSRAWTPEEWAAEAKGGPSCGGSDDEADDADMPRVGDVDGGPAAPSVGNGPLEGEASGASSEPPAGPTTATTSIVGKRSGMSQAERLRMSQVMERSAITFGKSGIHGWGLFARAALPAGAIVIEYRGEAMRAGMAERRERAYNATGTDCYLFTVNEDRVIDATMAGAIGRFTNHSCSPSMYSRILEVDKVPRLVFMTRSAVQAGQELTYDYRFKEEAGESKMHCRCGAPNCRGSLN